MSHHTHATDDTHEERSPRSFIVLSIAAALITIALKGAAYWLTGSVGLLSDAMESVVNLMAAGVTFWVLTVAALPPDEEHTYGHSKAEYFASGAEAVLILLAAAGIFYAAVQRILHPAPLGEVWIGVVISVVASGVNGYVALILLKAGKRLHSIGLTADAHHLLTDVWTSAGVIAGIVLVHLTGWLILDPIVAILMALNIVRIGVRLLDDTLHGLLDTALPAPDQRVIQDALEPFRERGIEFHAFRSRMSGRRRFVSMHVLVPGAWTVQAGHDVCDDVEQRIAEALPRTTVFTHLEPFEDPAAFRDQSLDRDR